MTLAEEFDKLFGEGEAQRLIEHAHTHDNGIHDRVGSDEFRWAVVIALGFRCAVYSWKHSFNEEQFWKFCSEHRAYIKEHDGDCDFLGLVCGVYNILNDPI